MTPKAIINVSVSNHYREPSYSSEIITQGILGEKVTVLDQAPSFTKVRQADGYESWVSARQIVSAHPLAGEDITVKSHFLRIYAEPSITAEGIKEAVIGSTLKAIDAVDDWYQIALPDGSTGWAEKSHFGSFPAFSPEAIITLAREFLGYQYSWGGLSPKGFDCSGFVQTVFRLTGGGLLSRDSWQQQQHNLISTDYHTAQPADLLFFGATPEKVTHVAISLGHERFIHARGWVRVNSFKETDSDFSRDLLNTFISVSRYSA
jgi:cell wall-associated NlpC family hydrolase